MNSVILLQIVVVIPGTHLVKNHDSPGLEPLSPSSKNVSKIEDASKGLYVTRQLI